MLEWSLLILALLISISASAYAIILIYDLTLTTFFKFNGQKLIPYVTSKNFLLKKLLEKTVGLISPIDKILELGCGNAKILKALVQKYDCTGVGYELQIAPFLSALIRTYFLRQKIKIHHQNFFNINFKNYTVIYGYLLPYLMPQVEEKILKECAPGTLIILNSFPLPNLRPFDTIKLPAKNELSSKIFFYRL